MNDQQLRKKIVDWFRENPNPSDDTVHELAESLNVNPHDFETIIYSLLTDFVRDSGKASADGMTRSRMAARRQKRDVVAVLIKAGRNDLAEVLAKSAPSTNQDRGYCIEAEMRRPGPYIELEGKPGIWQVTAFQPHLEDFPTRPINELAWGRIQRLTKQRKLTGKEFYAYFFKDNKVSVAWKGRRQMFHRYKEATLAARSTEDVEACGLL